MKKKPTILYINGRPAILKNQIRLKTKEIIE